jgi:hypothetical protein
VTFIDPYKDIIGGGDGRPDGIPDYMPYVCATTGRVCIDRLPVTNDEVRACGDALTAIYNARVEAR